MSTTSLDSPQDAVDQMHPVLSARCVLRGRHLAVCLLFAGLFAYVNCMPLLDSSIWLHLSDGGRMLDQRALPRTDVAQPLTDGMRIVHTAWLSSVAYAAADRWGGPHYVSNLFALVMLAYLLVLARVFYEQTGRVGLMSVGIGLALILGARASPYASPEIFGQLAFALLLWLVMRVRDRGLGPILGDRTNDSTQRGSWPVWIATGLLFVAWANLHGSYLLGIAVLICLAVARAIEVGLREKSLKSILADKLARRWLLLAEWALVASFLNPYGPRLIVELFRLVRDERVLALSQWAPLSISALDGMLLLGSLVLLAVVLRHSRRVVHPVEVLLLGVFGLATISTGRALSWYAVICAFAIMPHVADAWSRILPARDKKTDPGGSGDGPDPEKSPRLTAKSFTVTLLCLLVLYCGFRWAPISREFLGGTPRDMAALVGSEDLCDAADYLAEHPSPGLIYAPVDWSDWLVWRGDGDIQVLMTSNVQHAPRRIWSDHRRMALGEEGWYKGMDRYRVETLVLDKQNQGYFVKVAQRSTKYYTAYENDTVVVLRRLPDGRPPKLT